MTAQVSVSVHLAPAISEKQFQTAVVAFARVSGWRTFHFRPAWTHKGFKTAVEGDGGYPDLTLVRDRVIFAELKGPRGRLSEDQVQTVAALRTAGAEAYVWRPVDWPEIQLVLSTRVRPAPQTSPAATAALMPERAGGPQ